MICEPCKDARRQARERGVLSAHAEECPAHGAITRQQLRLAGHFKRGNRSLADLCRPSWTAKAYTRIARWWELEALRRYDSWPKATATAELQRLFAEWAREYGPGTCAQLSEKAGREPLWWMRWLDERELELRLAS